MHSCQITYVIINDVSPVMDCIIYFGCLYMTDANNCKFNLNNFSTVKTSIPTACTITELHSHCSMIFT